MSEAQVKAPPRLAAWHQSEKGFGQKPDKIFTVGTE